MRRRGRGAGARAVWAFWGDEGWTASEADSDSVSEPEFADGSNGVPRRVDDNSATARFRSRTVILHRPSIPPVLFVVAGTWASLLLASSLIAPDGALSFCADMLLAGAVVVLAACALALVVAAWQARATFLSLLAIGALLGGALACANELSLRHDERALGSLQAGAHVFTAVADASPSEYGASVTARMESAAGGSVCVRVLMDEATVRCGEPFSASVTLDATDPDVAARLRAQGVVGTVSAYAPVEQLPREGVIGSLVGLRARAIALFDGFSGEGAALCTAILLGDRTDLAQEEAFYGDVKAIGLAHLIAVSGSHLVVVVGMVDCALRAVRTPRRTRIVIVCGFMVAYVVLTGMPVSAIRAAVMSAIGLAAPYVRRRSGGLSALAVCAFAMLAVDPSCAASLSLQLSVASTFGIVAFMPLVRSWVTTAMPWIPAALADAVAMTLAASALTLPLTIPAFSQVPLISPLANVLAGPAFALLCCAGLAAVVVSLIVTPVASVALAPIVWLAHALAEGVAVLAAIPYAAIPVTAEAVSLALGGVVLCVVAWVAWPQPTARALWCVMAVACSLFVAMTFLLPCFGGDEVVMLDVGQGDSFLIRSEGASLLVDTGMSDSLLLEGLAKAGVTRLDAVLITHPDADHCKALASLRSTVQVERVLVARDGLSCPCENCEGLRTDAERVAPGALGGLAPGESIRVGAFSLRILGPDAYEDEGGNADSVCFVLEHGGAQDGAPGWTALFCGDAEAETIRAYVDEGRVASVDVLKVAHHGAKASLDEELTAVLDPDIALVSAGEGNPYGHPTEEALSLLEGVGAAVFRTDKDGEVTCRFSSDAITVTCENG